MRIGRWLAMVAMTLAMMGCGNVTPAERDLTSRWPAHVEPAIWQPVAGSCHQAFTHAMYRHAYDPVDCASPHQFEIVHVGSFTGDVASHMDPPREGSPDLRAAWADCDAMTSAYLGGPWRDRQIWIGLSVPPAQGWHGGARWYACHAGAAAWVGQPKITLQESIKGGFTKLAKLRWGCGDHPPSGDYRPKSCDEPHDSEFAGSFPLDLPFAEVHAKYQRNDPVFHAGCLKVIAGYLRLPHDRSLAGRVASAYWLPDQADWEAGDRSVRCHLSTSPRKVSRSLEGAGPSALPVYS